MRKLCKKEAKPQQDRTLVKDKLKKMTNVTHNY